MATVINGCSFLFFEEHVALGARSLLVLFLSVFLFEGVGEELGPDIGAFEGPEGRSDGFLDQFALECETLVETCEHLFETLVWRGLRR